jgi:hypothetical protein
MLLSVMDLGVAPSMIILKDRSAVHTIGLVITQALVRVGMYI